MKLHVLFLGKSTSRSGKEVVASGGRLEKSTSNSRNQVWKNLNRDVKLGRELCLENQLPNITGNLNKKESSGEFDFLQNSNNPTHPINSRPLRGPSTKWTQAHFSLKITIAFDGDTQCTICWSNFVQPIGAKLGPVMLEPEVKHDQAYQAKPTKAQNDFIKNLVRLIESSS